MQTLSKIFSGKLIRAGNNAKTIKGDNETHITAVMYLAPADQVPGPTLCPFAEIAGCKSGCLNTAGRGRFDNVQLARNNKAIWFKTDRATFMATLIKDIRRFIKWCAKRNAMPAIRLNGTSDVPFHRITIGEHKSIVAMFPEVIFYDYTKVVKRARESVSTKNWPANYGLVLSYSEANPDYAKSVLEAHAETGVNIAVVFRTKERAEQAVRDGWKGLPVLNGDKNDKRFLDAPRHVVALYAKGNAKTDTSGFVID